MSIHFMFQPRQQRTSVFPSGLQRQLPSDIVIMGFRDLRHFLSWYNIRADYPLIFPATQTRSIRRIGDCIILSGFNDLQDFLRWASQGNYQAA